MGTEHTNHLIAEFLNQPSHKTLDQLKKADSVELAVHLGWTMTKHLPWKDEMREIVESSRIW